MHNCLFYDELPGQTLNKGLKKIKSLSRKTKGGPCWNIDPEMRHLTDTMNELGYDVIFSCGGHLRINESYVMFQATVQAAYDLWRLVVQDDAELNLNWCIRPVLAIPNTFVVEAKETGLVRSSFRKKLSEDLPYLAEFFKSVQNNVQEINKDESRKKTRQGFSHPSSCFSTSRFGSAAYGASVGIRSNMFITADRTFEDLLKTFFGHKNYLYQKLVSGSSFSVTLDIDEITEAIRIAALVDNLGIEMSRSSWGINGYFLPDRKVLLTFAG